MDAESEVWDEICDRLTVIYNHMRLLRSDIDQRARENARDEAKLASLEAKASQYEALIASDTETGITA